MAGYPEYSVESRGRAEAARSRVRKGSSVERAWEKCGDRIVERRRCKCRTHFAPNTQPRCWVGSTGSRGLASLERCECGD